ncbi:hypothetical protein PUNSTDRAFT_54425 [Punctularia strigosozonata HHB-11173 SS5]|uniref:uncharacterized protein n=1 Tax=Punctularia strigosozonata (strain HHB-11173) TaxID=741275 RepID=UPI00044170B2|nr:uncharacterized protein PUNSTDRAFT_54425 [Punctularia strigosozonata HHB-11173 SS5]EIN06112.1 hypothetical protein PUNSTDRAFT_54425 [Punctularia strigosozonata HHB-11173 SS5]
MDAFEDENPFQTDVAPAFAAPSSPPASTPSSPPRPGARSPPLSRPSFPSPGSHGRPKPAFKEDYCCTRDQWLHSGEDVEIQIVDAQKTSVNSTSPYITYVIRAGNATASHRYSEFESLRLSLAKLYPTLIVPPIPSKQTIGDYAVKQAKAKEDAQMIARRKRMLQTFLNRVAKHPILSNEHVFHRFLDGEVSWTEVLHSPPLTLLPKNILRAPAHNPTDSSSAIAYASLPNPSPSHPLRRPDQRFLDSEAFTNKFAAHLQGPMEKVTRRTMKRWSEYSQDHAELGAALNGFSLNETGELAAAIEKTGQAVDTTYLSTTRLLQDLEQNWQEPLSEYTQFASIIKKLLAYRHQKHVQVEMTQDALEARREQLNELEKHEREARRLEEALSRSTIRSLPNTPSPGSGTPDPGSPTSPALGSDRGAGEGVGSDAGVGVGGSQEWGGAREREGEGEREEYGTRSLPPHPGPNPVKRRAPGMGLLSALSYTLHGMIDSDPEAARRSSISKTRETISNLEDALHLSAQDLKYASSTIQADLDRFQRQKVADLREMCISMARAHRDWCKKNMEAWEEAQKEIAKIPEHPNHPPESEGQGKGTQDAGRPRSDSTATINGR